MGHTSLDRGKLSMSVLFSFTLSLRYTFLIGCCIKINLMSITGLGTPIGIFNKKTLLGPKSKQIFFFAILGMGAKKKIIIIIRSHQSTHLKMGIFFIIICLENNITSKIEPLLSQITFHKF